MVNLTDDLLGFFEGKDTTEEEAVEAMAQAIGLLCSNITALKHAKKIIDQMFQKELRGRLNET